MKPSAAFAAVVRRPLWLLAGGYWVWLIWACAGEWTTSEDYNYGWFVPLLAVYFLWKRIERADGPAPAPPEAGAGKVLAWTVLAVSVLLVFPLEVVRQTPIHWRPNLWSIGLLALANTLAVAWLSGGSPARRIVLVPALFMLVGIPWPTFVENAISFPLMQVVTRWSVGFLHLAGYPATAMGTTIMLPNCTVGVEEACSGLRSLQTALMVGLAAGELTRLHLAGRGILLGVAFGLAVAANQARVLMLSLAGIRGGNAAVEDVHDGAGYLVLAILLVGVGLVAWVLARWRNLMRGVPPAEVRNSWTMPDSPGLARPGVVLLAVAGAALFASHGWYWLRASMASPPQPALLAPSVQGGFMVDADVPQSILGVLQPDEYRYIRESVDGTPTRVIGYHFYWKPRRGNANQLYHRPDRCMPGAGWRIDGDVVRKTLALEGGDFTFNVFPLRSPGGPALLLWGAFLNGEPVEIEFNTDVYLGTANLWQFVRTGTRVHSYEVAACILPYVDGHQPAPEEVAAYARRVFSAAKPPRTGG